MDSVKPFPYLCHAHLTRQVTVQKGCFGLSFLFIFFTFDNDDICDRSDFLIPEFESGCYNATFLSFTLV